MKVRKTNVLRLAFYYTKNERALLVSWLVDWVTLRLGERMDCCEEGMIRLLPYVLYV